MRPAVFLDKDGTILRDVPYNACPALIEWAPGAPEALRRLAAAGFALVLVTNQSGVARGAMTEVGLARYLRGLEERLAEEGVGVAAMEYCPHHPEGAVRAYRRFCTCRKPNPGMLVRAAANHGLDLSRSWMIGDLLDDVEAGSRAGCRTVLLGIHEDQIPAEKGPRSPDYVERTIGAAVERVIASSKAVA